MSARALGNRNMALLKMSMARKDTLGSKHHIEQKRNVGAYRVALWLSALAVSNADALGAFVLHNIYRMNLQRSSHWKCRIFLPSAEPRTINKRIRTVLKGLKKADRARETRCKAH